jgi:fatty-acyl-CoA synthase
MPKTISSAITWWARSTPEALAVAVGGDRVSYREFDQWVSAIAADLQTRGVKVGDRVATLAAHSTAHCALIFGAIRAGGIAAPLGLRLTAYELGEIIEDFEPVLLYAEDESRQKLNQAAGPSRTVLSMADVDALRGISDATPTVCGEPASAALIMCTSGSTARPKGVVLTNQSLLEGATQYAFEDPACCSGGRTLLVAPMSVSAACVQMIIFGALGCSLYLEPAFEPELILNLLAVEKINLFGAAPVFLERIAASPGFAAADLSSISYAYTGGARVPKALLEAWHRKGVVFCQMYGITECGGMATVMPRELALEYPEKCGPGRIFNQIRIVDENGVETPPGVEGEVILQTPDMMWGYWNNPEATAEALRDGWLYTGDIGVKDEQGMLTFVDRKKDLIVSGGLKVAAAEVERAISEFAGVEEVVVIAAPDPKFGETPFAVIYSRQEISIPDLIAHCNVRLASYKVPRYVVRSDEPLPRLAAGKLSKPAIRALYKGAETWLERVR